MKGLAGDFATMPLTELMVHLGRRNASGTLVLEREGTKKTVLIEAGQVTNAASSQPREYLGQFLINLGHISEDQYHRAFQTQNDTKVFLGRILVMIGLVSEENVKTVLALKFRETVLEACTWADGQFTFEANVRPEQLEGVEVKVPLTEMHRESEFRHRAWDQIRKVFPSTDCTLQLHRDHLAVQPKPGSLDDRLMTFIEQGQTLEELALRLHATDYFFYQRLYALHRLGAITVRPPGAAVRSDAELGLGDNPTAEQILAAAKKFFAEGNHRDAFSLARRSHQVTPSIEATVLLKDIETAWSPQLRADLITRKRVPSIGLNAETVKTLPLTAPERYLISRIDGKREIEAIIRVAPLKEFDSLAFFDRFVASGWVRLSA